MDSDLQALHPVSSSFALDEKASQRLHVWHGGRNPPVIAPRRQGQAAHSGGVLLESLLVLLSDFAGRAGNGAFVFHSLKPVRHAIRQPLFVGVDQVKRDYFPPSMAKQANRGERLFQIVYEEIRKQRQHAAAWEP